jgi:2-polyprenyl-3-methyl-5-hydroxy-6-metoxy-1,4-benzoquinol methylase
MIEMDEKQKLFEDYEVPDTIRIKKVLAFLRKYFPDLCSVSLLECGIAKGGLTDLLSKEGTECWGVDFNPRKIEGVHIIQADLNMGFPEFNRCFDVIFAGELMEHLFDDAKFIENCRRLLKPGGLLIITVPNLVFIVNRFRMLFGKMPLFAYMPFHYHIYTKKTLKDLVEKSGFKILQFSSSHILFSTRRNRFGRIFEILGDIFPSMGAHLIVYAEKV